MINGPRKSELTEKLGTEQESTAEVDHYTSQLYRSHGNVHAEELKEIDSLVQCPDGFDLLSRKKVLLRSIFGKRASKGNFSHALQSRRASGSYQIMFWNMSK